MYIFCLLKTNSAGFQKFTELVNTSAQWKPGQTLNKFRILYLQFNEVLTFTNGYITTMPIVVIQSKTYNVPSNAKG